MKLLVNVSVDSDAVDQLTVGFVLTWSEKNENGKAQYFITQKIEREFWRSSYEKNTAVHRTTQSRNT
jgi:esterase/lipase superfamily enzyme